MMKVPLRILITIKLFNCVWVYQPESHDHATHYTIRLYKAAVLIMNLLLSIGTELFTSSMFVNLWVIHESITTILDKENNSLGSNALWSSLPESLSSCVMVVQQAHLHSVVATQSPVS